jgi:hypothetical protein
LDAESIAAGIQALLANPGNRRAIQERAITWASQYAWPPLAQRMAGMIAGLVTTAAVPGGADRTVMPAGWERSTAVDERTFYSNTVDEFRQATPVQQMAVNAWLGSASRSV